VLAAAKGDVQQRFVQVAFRQFGGRTLRGIGLSLNECPPGGDGPCRVVADIGHVRETHGLGIRSQFP
jgi:hypothetical protein